MLISHSDNIVLMWLSRKPKLQKREIVHVWVGGMSLRIFLKCSDMQLGFLSSGVCVCVCDRETEGGGGAKPLFTCFFL